MAFALIFMGAPAFAFISHYLSGKPGILLNGIILFGIFFMGFGILISAVWVLLGWSKTDAAKRQKQIIPGSAIPKQPACKKSDRKYYRLKPDPQDSNFWYTFMFSLMWNGFTWGVCFGLTVTLDNFPYFVWIMFSPFNAIGLYLLWQCVKHLVAWYRAYTLGVGVDSSTVTAGQALNIKICTRRKCRYDRLAAGLIMMERATYGIGSSQETKEQVRQIIPLCNLENPALKQGHTLTDQSIKVPVDAFPSFKSEHNQILWFIRVMMIPKVGAASHNVLFPVRVLSPEIARLKEGRQIAKR